MRKYRKILKDELSDVVCDFCGKSCIRHHDDVGSSEFAVLKARWGYWSRKDESSCDYDICEDCFDRILVFAKTISDDSALK